MRVPCRVMTTPRTNRPAMVPRRAHGGASPGHLSFQDGTPVYFWSAGKRAEEVGRGRGLGGAGAAAELGRPGGHGPAITEATSHETDDGNRETHAPKHTSQRLRRRLVGPFEALGPRPPSCRSTGSRSIASTRCEAQPELREDFDRGLIPTFSRRVALFLGPDTEGRLFPYRAELDPSRYPER